MISKSINKKLRLNKSNFIVRGKKKKLFDQRSFVCMDVSRYLFARKMDK